jgi:hypothetical protein
MGLDVCVFDSHGHEIYNFRVGGYGYFASFRDKVIEGVRGAVAAKVYRHDRLMKSMTSGLGSIFTGGDPDAKRIYSILTGQVRSTSGSAVDELSYDSSHHSVCPDLDLFIYHSDCDGSFSADECKKLFKIFTENKKKICKSTDAKFLETFKHFERAFKKAASTGGELQFT